MDETRKSGRTILKAVVAATAVLNLILLFGFNYDVPGISVITRLKNVVSGIGEEKPAEAMEAEAGNGGEEVLSAAAASSAPAQVQEIPAGEAGFVFDPEVLTYDGSGALDLMEGVRYSDGSEEIPSDEIFAEILTSDDLTTKTVRYTAETGGELAEATRTLKLSGYNGPSITLGDELPEVSSDELDQYVSRIAGTEVKAQDGFGEDISSAVTASYTIPSSDPDEAQFVFTIVNRFGDSASVSAPVPLKLTKPVVFLVKDHDTMKVGEDFFSLDYLQAAVDVNGSSLSHSVSVYGTIDTSKPGTYELTYLAQGAGGNWSDPAVLTITVEE